MRTIYSFYKAKGTIWQVRCWGGSAIFAALTFAVAPSAFGSTSGLPAACLGHSIPGVGNQNSCGAPGSYSVNFKGGVYASTVSASPNPAGSVSVSAGSQAEGAAADINYYIEFSGPTATVPIQVNATASASGIGGNAQLWITDPQYNTSYLNLIASTDGGAYYGLNGLGPCSGDTLGQQSCGASYVPGTAVSNNLTWTAKTNFVYYVNLDASVRSLPNNGNASASIDPTFSIASSVPDPQDYSILISDGIGNPAASTASPEPSTAILLFSGIGTVVCLARRKRNE